MVTQGYERSRPPSATTVQIEALLLRYPDLSEDELAILIDLFPYIKILDLGLMTADERLAGKLEAFRKDHGHKMRTPISSLVVFLAVPTVMLVSGLLWWLLG